MTDLQRQPVVLLVDAARAAGRDAALELRQAGYTVWHSKTGIEARQVLAEAQRNGLAADAVVIHRDLPDVDGLALCPFLRAMCDAPMIVCDPGAPPLTRTLTYSVGADGCVASDDPHELQALLRVMLRRSSYTPADVAELDHDSRLRVGSLTIHVRAQSVRIGETHIPLTPTQFKLLLLLAKNANALVLSSQLLASIWGCDMDEGAKTMISGHIARVRAKLRDASPEAPRLVNVASRGYRLLAA